MATSRVRLAALVGLLLVLAGAPSSSQQAGLIISGSPPLPAVLGGTANVAPSDDQLLVGTGTTFQLKTLSDCTGAGKAVTYVASSNTFGCNTISSGSGNFLEVSVSLGTEGGLAYSSTVTGQAWVTASSQILCEPFATTSDGQTIETYAAAGLRATAASRVNGVGFDLWVYSPHGATGTFRFHCTGV